jgi:hypothetical protein
VTPREAREALAALGYGARDAWWYENGSAAVAVDETAPARVRALVIRYGAGGSHASTPSLHVLIVLADAASHDGWERDAPAGTSSTADGKFDLHASEDNTGTLRVNRGDKASPAGTP